MERFICNRVEVLVPVSESIGHPRDDIGKQNNLQRTSQKRMASEHNGPGNDGEGKGIGKARKKKRARGEDRKIRVVENNV